MAPANATQSPPDLAALYTQLHAQDQQAAHIDRGLAMMASAFGTAQQQHDMMNYAQNTPVDDRTAVVGKSLLAQKELTEQQEHSRFMAGAAGMSKLLGVTPDQAAWLSNNPDALNEVLKTHFEAMTPTEAMKNVDAATKAYAQANPNATPEEIAGFKAKAMVGLTGGPMAEAQKVQAKDAQQFKDNAVEDYTGVDAKLRETQRSVDELLKDPNHTMSALTTPFPTTGAAGYWMPGMAVSQETKNKAILIDKLKASLTGDSLRDVKNVRNIREFDTLGRALTAALDPANSQDQVIKALTDMKDKILDARATAEMAAGHHLSGELVGHGNRDLIDPKNPYYNGATEDEKAKDGGGGGSASGGGPTYTYNPKTGQLE
jgi:hypothetical protein